MTSIAIPHMKVHGFSGDHLLTRCEDVGCTVDEHGQAECGRVACPGCGFSGSNLSEPEGFQGDTVAHSLTQCSCGHEWIPEPRPARVAAPVAA
jgi:hypothetical protein